MKYQYNLNRPHLPFAKIDDKMAYVINSMIMCSMWDIFEFIKKADVTVLDDDTMKRHIEIDEDAEVKTGNVLIYNVIPKDIDQNYFAYDRMIIHHSIGKSYSYWAFDFTNTETGHTMCYDTIEYTFDDLIQHIKMAWHSFRYQIKYEQIKKFHEKINFKPMRLLNIKTLAN